MLSTREYLLAAAIAAASSVGQAQTVTGRVVSPTRPGGVAGAVVLLFDAAGDTRSRALTTQTGDFALRAPAPGAFTIRVRAIGIHPITIGPIAVARDTTIAVQATDVALALPAITTNERSQCQLRPDSALALGALWEDAKTALLAAAISRDRPEYRFDVTAHVRDYDPATQELVAVGIRDGQINNTRSWTSRSPNDLRDNGYVSWRGDSVEFYAPDVETLLSSYFTDTHCFRFAPSRKANDPFIGIAFEPSEKVGHAEIRGTLRIDRSTRRLSALDFRFVDTRMSDSSYGGHVEFTALATGAWAITDWWIRVPTTGLAVGRRSVGVAVPGQPAKDSRGIVPLTVTIPERRVSVFNVDISGGTVRDIRLDTTIVWSRTPSSISFKVAERGAPDGPRGGGVAYLIGTDRRAVIDSTGVVRFANLTSGRYLIEIGTPELDLLGWPRAHLAVDADTMQRDTPPTVFLESPLVAAQGVCGEEAGLLSPETGVLIGTVMRAGKPVGGVDVAVEYKRAEETQTKRARTFAADGRFVVCGVPRQTPISVTATGASPLTMKIDAARVLGTTSISIP